MLKQAPNIEAHCFLVLPLVFARRHVSPGRVLAHSHRNMHRMQRFNDNNSAYRYRLQFLAPHLLPPPYRLPLAYGNTAYGKRQAVTINVPVYTWETWSIIHFLRCASDNRSRATIQPSRCEK